MEIYRGKRSKLQDFEILLLKNKNVKYVYSWTYPFVCSSTKINLSFHKYKK